MKFIFRADADKENGVGHLIRSLSLAEAFIRRGHDIQFVSRCESKTLKAKIVNVGCEFIPIDPFRNRYDTDPFLRFLKESDTTKYGKKDKWGVGVVG